MRCGHVLAVGGTALLIAATLAQGQTQHLTDAITHAQAAVAQGKQGYPDALAAQAREALKHAEAAKKEAATSHLDEAIQLLRRAIDQGKQGQAEAAIQSAEGALAHFSAGGQPPAESAQSRQEEGGY